MAEQERGVVWSGRPWIGPAVAVRTVGLMAAAVLAYAGLSAVGLLTVSFMGVSIYIWALGLLGVAWLASLAGLVILRASHRYVLRQSSMEVDRGIVSRKTLLVSPSAFSELEVDQGLVGRMLNYGSIEVRSQGGQQLNLMLVRDPREISAMIRAAMTVPTVRIAKDEQVAVAPPR